MSLRLAQTADGMDFVNDNGLQVDDGLETAVILSLFQDARATGDELAEAGLTPDQNRGWWGDSFPEIDGDVEGSKLWLLARALRSDESLARGKTYAEEALQWLLDDDIAREVNVETWWFGEGPAIYEHRFQPGTSSEGLMVLSVQIIRRNGQRWQRVWEAVSGNVLEAP
jgi:phage gp46-like protein